MAKYAHYSDVDPEFAPIQGAVREMVDQLFSLPIDQIRAAMLQPSPLPEDIPKDIQTDDMEVPVRDGTKIGIRVYKSKDVGPDALLYFVMHGGGKICLFQRRKQGDTN